MKIEQSGNVLYCGLPRKGGKIELIMRGKDGRVKEMITLIPAGNTMWLIFKMDGEFLIDNSHKRAGLKVEIPMPLKGSVTLVFPNATKDPNAPSTKTATFSWGNNETLTLMPSTKTP